MSASELDRRETRERLLDAAGEIFAEHGFRSATVRDICERAGANIAAIHYHFGDKGALYSAVLREAHSRSLERFPALVPGLAGAPPEERLAVFVRSFLQRIFDAGQPAWFGRLIAREMVEPSPALDALVEANIRPQCQLLMEVVRELLGPASSDERLRWCAGSIVGQCVFYHHSRPVIARLFPEQDYAPADIERLAGHIARFSVSALTAMRAEAERPYPLRGASLATRGRSRSRAALAVTAIPAVPASGRRKGRSG